MTDNSYKPVSQQVRPPMAYLLDNALHCPTCAAKIANLWRQEERHRITPLTYTGVMDYEAEMCASEGAHCRKCHILIYRSY